MPKIQRILKHFLIFLLFGLFSGLSVIFATYLYLKPELPSLETLQDVRFHIPLRVYTRDDKLIAEFGEKRRTPIKYEDVPDTFVKAILAAEDQNFFKHSGVDIKGLSRAVVLMIKNMGSIEGGGGSTITMQLTRALFLTKERKFKRKFKEIILAVQIENELPKEKILELYFNEIYLGKRAYGIQAAAKVYYDRNIDQLTLAQQAMIAGLPKAPATNNPVNNPENALVRRNWILGRMLELGFISKAQYTQAINEPITAKDHGQANEVEAPYLAEMIRQQLYAQYGDSIYTEGYKAYSTILSEAQTAANRALRSGIHEYSERHGYQGIISHVEDESLPIHLQTYLEQNQQKYQQGNGMRVIKNNKDATVETITAQTFYDLGLLAKILSDAEFNLKQQFSDIAQPGDLKAALTLLIDDEKQAMIVQFEDSSFAFVNAEDVLWAAPFVDRNTVGDMPETISDVLESGDMIYLRQHQGRWRLAQVPEVQAALVAMDPHDGAIISLVGGFDHSQSKYNRVIQGSRQAGSSFKPFIYTKALESGFTAATIENDAPVVFEDEALEATWKPENSGGRFYGPTRIRQALYRSRNLVSIRVLRKIGISDTIASMERFGFKREQLPNNLSLALGSASLNPLEVATGFSVFANGGYQVFPYFLDELQDADGNILFKENPVRVCPECLLEEESNEVAAQKDELLIENTGELETPDKAITGNGDDEVKPIEEQAPRIAESVIEPRVNYIIDSMLADVVKQGTGRRALALGRKDIRGKTGTTNDQIDAWFTGYNNDLVASVWVGFDAPQTLGRSEFGATAALPIWYYFMEQALSGKPESVLKRPSGMVTVKINAETGEAAPPGDPNAIFEIFREEYAPKLNREQSFSPKNNNEVIPEQLF